MKLLKELNAQTEHKRQVQVVTDFLNGDELDKLYVELTSGVREESTKYDDVSEVLSDCKIA